MIQKIIYIICLVLTLGIIVKYGKDVYSDYAAAKAEKEKLTADMMRISDENDKLQKKLDGFSNSETVIKELKARFNYKLPQEKVIIVAPEKAQKASE